MATRTLKFAIKLNKNKQPRINVVDTLHDNKAVGSFDRTLKRACDFDAWETLTLAQQLELSLYWQNIKGLFEYFDTECDATSQYRLLIPEAVEDYLATLSQACDEHDIDFQPTTVLLQSLIRAITYAEKALAEKGVNMTSPNCIKSLPQPVQGQKQLKQQYSQHIKAIFTALNDTFDKHDKFIDASHDYGKDQTLSDKVISLVAAGKSKVSAWQISCALTVLGRDNNAKVHSIPLPVLIDLWLVPLIKQAKITNEKEAIDLFKQTFTSVTDLSTAQCEITQHLNNATTQ